ncbi:MAG TPA: hypothetical protein VF175_12100 [Lacipirellula sp.]
MAYKIQRLGLGGVLDQAIAITRNHFVLLFSIIAILLIPYLLAFGSVQYAMELDLPPEPTMDDIMRAQEASMAYLPWFFLLLFGYTAIIWPIANAAVIQAVARLYLGEEVTAGEAIKHALRRFFPLVLTSILMTLIIGVGFALLIIPGIYFMIWYGLSQHVVVLEGLSGMTALKRSKQLVHPQRGTFLALLLITGIMSWLVNMSIAFIPQPIVAIFASALVQGMMTVLITATFVVFYFSARCSVENFDLMRLAENIGAREAEEGEPSAQFERGTSL